MNSEFAEAMANYDQNRTRGVIDAIATVGNRLGPNPIPHNHSGSIEFLVDIIDDLLATEKEYFNQHSGVEGRSTGYHYTLTLLRSLCHLTGRE